MRIRTKSNTRGLRDIRTRSGRVDRSDVPYMAYMKISCLEMEKARRDKERFSASTRISNIDARLAEIEAEKGALLVRLGERSQKASPRSKDAPNVSAEEATGKNRRGFRIKY